MRAARRRCAAGVLRPAWVTPPTALVNGGSNVTGTYDISSEEAPVIAKVVLMRPGSVTHHFNFDQRYVQLSFSQSGGTLTITPAANEFMAPKGHWMLFLISTDGLPSDAAWVVVQ
jgi:hypothetical protein